MPDTFFLIFGIIVALLGAIILFAMIRSIAKCRTRVEATICSLKTEKTSLRGTTVYSYSPVVSYEVNGNSYEANAPFSTGKKDKYIVGNKLVIYINASDPSDYRFPGKLGLWITGFVMLALGLLFIVLCFI